MNDDPSPAETELMDPAAATTQPPPTHGSEEATVAMDQPTHSGAVPPRPPASRPAHTAHLWGHRPRWHWAALSTCLVIGAVLIGVAIGYGVWGGSDRQIVFPGQHRGNFGFGMPNGNSGGVPNGTGYGMPYGYGNGGSGQNGSGSNGSGSGSGGLGSGGSSSSGSGAPSNISGIASGVNPGLVDLNVTVAYQNGQASATGIVITSSGEVLTNNHVVEGASNISATDVGNGKTYKATVVGYDRSHDIAVLQLSGASGLQTVSIGDSSTVSVGDAVVAIGNAGGSGGTPSAAGGSVIALGRQIVADGAGGSEPLSGLIEVNAAVQPGDSGGPLVDSSSRVIGIDTAASVRFALRGLSGGRGYAVPIDQALAITKEIENGTSSATVHIGSTAFLGVALATSRAQGANGLGGQGGGISGATVAGVLPGTPAAKAGMRAGDVITSLGGQRVDSAGTLTSLVGGHRPGDSVQVVWTDQSGKAHTAMVTLATGPAA